MESLQEKILIFQSVSGLSEEQCRDYLQRNGWDLEQSLSAYFDAGLDPPEKLAVVDQNAIAHFYSHEEEEPEEIIASLLCNNVRGILHSLDVSAQIRERMAEVKICFTFENSLSENCEATFRFRQPKASVTFLEVEIDDRKLQSKIEEKHSAKQKYQESIEKGHGAVLVHEDDKKVGIFKAKIGNMLPNQYCKIGLTYITELSDGKNNLTFTIPATTVPIVADQNKNVIAIRIEADMIKPITGVKSEFNIAMHEQNSYNGSRVSLMYNSKERLLNEFSVTFELDTTIDEIAKAMVERYEPPGYLQQHAAVNEPQGKETTVALYFRPDFTNYADEERIITSEIIFLVDRSGSMSGSRMKQAKNALQFFLRSLPSEPHDIRFNIVSFGSTFRTLFPTSVKYDEETFKHAKNEVAKFDSDMEGTDILSPLRHVLEGEEPDQEYPRQIICLTDGEVENTLEILQLIRKHKSTTRVFTLGVGMDASKDLVECMAYEGRGKAEFVLAEQRVEPKVLLQLKRALQPTFSNVKLSFGGAISDQEISDYYRISPSEIPAIYDGEVVPIYILTNSQIPDSFSVTLSGDFNYKPVTFDIAVRSADAQSGHILHHFAVSAVIRDLELKAEEGNKEARDDCVALSTAYHILSKYTTFITIDPREAAANIPQLPINIGEEKSFSVVPDSLIAGEVNLLNFEEEEKESKSDYYCYSSEECVDYDYRGGKESENSQPFSKLVDFAVNDVSQQHDSLNSIAILSSDPFSPIIRDQQREKLDLPSISLPSLAPSPFMPIPRASSSSISPPPPPSIYGPPGGYPSPIGGSGSMNEGARMASFAKCSAPPPSPSPSFYPSPSSLSSSPSSMSSSSSSKDCKSKSKKKSSIEPQRKSSPPSSSSSFRKREVKKEAKEEKMEIKKEKQPEVRLLNLILKCEDEECDEEEEEEEERCPEDSRPLDKLVFLQKMNGSWDHSSTLEKLLPKLLSADSAALGVTKDVWCTMFVIEYIKKNYQELVEEWELLVKKAEKWLHSAFPDWQQHIPHIQSLLLFSKEKNVKKKLNFN